MILVGPFQLRIFRDSTKPPFLLGWLCFPQWLETSLRLFKALKSAGN